MKKELHPTYHPEAKINCACGHVFTVGSTTEAISIEICSQCHPFYTGKQKLLDSARRVDKFQKRVEAKTAASEKAKGKKVKKAKQATIKKAKKTEKDAK
jgi:large subunit ribosomal protein L31